MGKATDFKFGR